MNTSYPLATYNFRVNVGATTLGFHEVSGIAIAYEHVVYRHGLSFLEGEQIATFQYDAFVPVTCKRGTILDSDPLALYDWLRSREMRGMDVMLCDPNGKALLSWRIAKAIPTKLSAPTFDAKSNEVSIDVLEIQVRGVSLGKL